MTPRSITDAILAVTVDGAFVAIPVEQGEVAWQTATRRTPTGQEHTFAGDRGLQSLQGVKLRDVADAVATVLHRHGIDEHYDRDAVAQSVCVLVEGLLGGSRWRKP